MENEKITASERLNQINSDILKMLELLLKAHKEKSEIKNANWGHVGDADAIASNLESAMVSMGLITEDQIKY